MVTTHPIINSLREPNECHIRANRKPKIMARNDRESNAKKQFSSSNSTDASPYAIHLLSPRIQTVENRLFTAAVIQESVVAALWINDLVLERQSHDSSAKLSGTIDLLLGHQVGDNTRDVRSGLGSTIQVLVGRVRSWPSAIDGDTWSEDVKGSTPVGEICSFVIEVGGTNGDGVWC
jgi:hypothetical protein